MAIVFAKEKGGTEEAAITLSKIEGVVDVLMVTGKDDMIAIVQVLSDNELDWLKRKLSEDPKIDSFELKKVQREWKR